MKLVFHFKFMNEKSLTQRRIIYSKAFEGKISYLKKEASGKVVLKNYHENKLPTSYRELVT